MSFRILLVETDRAAASVADSVSSGAGKIADSLHEKSSGRGSMSDKAARKASDVADDTTP